MRRLASIALTMGLLVLLPALATAQPYELSASVQPAEAEPGDTVLYTISVRYSGQPPAMVPPPPFDPSWGFGAPQFSGQQSMAQIINGVASQSVEFRFAFSVSKEGNFTIPPAKLEAGGKTYTSPPTQLTVRKFQATGAVPSQLQGKVAPPRVDGNPQLAKQLTGVIFVLPVIEKEKLYQGEQVLVSFHLCIDDAALGRLGLSAAGLALDRIALPKLSQFLTDEVYPVPDQTRYRKQLIGGKEYLVAPMYQVAITPTKTGSLTIDPFAISMWIRTSRGAPSPFQDDPFFRGLGDFGFGQNIGVVAQSPSLSVEVMPLPEEGRPADFSGAVGDFTLTATLDQSKVVADEDVVRLRVVAEGTGDASVVGAPELPKVDGLTLLEDPKSAVDRRTESRLRITTKKFDYAIRVTKPGKIQIPPVSMTVFNPKSGKYETIQSAPLSLEAVASAGSKAPLVAAAASDRTGGAQPGTPDKPKGLDIRYIHAGPLEPYIPVVERLGQPGMFAALAAPPLMLLAGWLLGLRRRSARNVQEIRRANAFPSAESRLAEAVRLASAGDRPGAVNELSVALRGYFADKLGVDPQSLTISDVEEALARRKVDEELSTAVREVWEPVDAALYAPMAPPESDFDVWFHQVRETILRVEGVRL